MKTVCVIGHFGGDKVFLDGQTVKTKMLTKALQEELGRSAVNTVDTYGGKKALLRCMFQAIAALKNHRNVVILPAHNGIRFFVPMLTFGNLFFHRRLHYAVVGGWLPQFLQKHSWLKGMLKKFHGIYVETNRMKQGLEALGLSNVLVLPNCKNIQVLTPEELIYSTEKPFRLCTFSRVMKEKGIEDAVEAVKAVNTQRGETVYTLDIYGQVDPSQTQWFADLQKTFPDYIRYAGMVPSDQSVSVLKDYFALLFPTFYPGEGFAGTLIDAMASGIPVIASDFRYNMEIVTEGKTGRLHPTADALALSEILDEASNHVDAWNEMKLHCIQKAAEYIPSKVIKVLTEQFQI